MTTQNLTAPDTTTADANRTARLYGMGCHLGAGVWAIALSWLIIHQLTVGQWSFTPADAVLLAVGLFAPLGLWFASQRQYPFVSRHYREVVNFQIAIALNTVLFSLLSLGYLVVMVLSTAEVCGEPEKSNPGIDPVTHPVIGFFAVLGVIRITQVGIAAWKALGGRSHRYPFILRFLR